MVSITQSRSMDENSDDTMSSVCNVGHSRLNSCAEVTSLYEVFRRPKVLFDQPHVCSHLTWRPAHMADFDAVNKPESDEAQQSSRVQARQRQTRLQSRNLRTGRATTAIRRYSTSKVTLLLPATLSFRPSCRWLISHHQRDTYLPYGNVS
jgi:hypothetical protein